MKKTDDLFAKFKDQLLKQQITKTFNEEVAPTLLGTSFGYEMKNWIFVNPAWKDDDWLNDIG